MIAEIHGKISSSGSNWDERLEDKLTGDVFGNLRYVPFEKGFAEIFSLAKNLNKNRIPFDLTKNLGKVNKPKVKFWPQLHYSEPDMVIEYGDTVFLVEVKYLSGKSGIYEENLGEDIVEKKEGAASPDQLYREFKDLLRYEDEEGFEKGCLIYLTKHRTFPFGDILSSAKACEESGAPEPELKLSGPELRRKFENKTYWISWFEVRKVIQDLQKQEEDCYKKLIFADISSLLFKKGLRQFEGFRCSQNIQYNPGEPVFYSRK